MKNNLLWKNVLAVATAAVGGLLGYFGFLWIARQGFYAIMLPGVLVGFGAGFFRTRSLLVCVLCGVLALGFGLFSEWRLAPFIADASLGYFLSHVHQLKPITLILIGLGVLIGCWVPFHNLKNPGLA